MCSLVEATSQVQAVHLQTGLIAGVTLVIEATNSSVQSNGAVTGVSSENLCLSLWGKWGGNHSCTVLGHSVKSIKLHAHACTS